jgi:hypothetical protein
MEMSLAKTELHKSSMYFRDSVFNNMYLFHQLNTQCSIFCLTQTEKTKRLLERLRKDVRRKRPEKWPKVSSSIMTSLRVTHHSRYGNFCQIKMLRCVLSHLIHRIWHRATSGSTQSQNDHER